MYRKLEDESLLQYLKYFDFPNLEKWIDKIKDFA